MKSILIVLTLLFTGNPEYQAIDRDAHMFVLMETNGRLSFERVTVDENSVVVLQDPAIITLILPLSTGMAGDLVQKQNKPARYIIRRKMGAFHVKARMQDGTEKEWPPVQIADLSSYNIRVNVIRGDGMRQAFKIYNYERVTADDGAVVDLFGGKIPMAEEDYSITLETTRARRAVYKEEPLEGSAPLEIVNNWPVVEARLDKGSRARFVIDCAATGSIISNSLLPEGTEITPVVSREYNLAAPSTRESKAGMQTAGGTVDSSNYLGKATLPGITFGDISITDLSVNVLQHLPGFMAKNGVDGILGLNVLQRSGAVSLHFPKAEDGSIRFLPAADDPGSARPIAFKPIGKLLVTEGRIGGIPINFILDTGARHSIISKTFFSNNNLENAYSVLDSLSLKGLDGREVQSLKVRIRDLEVGPAQYKQVEAGLSSLDVFSYLGMGDRAALLGMDFFLRFRSITFDFRNNKLYLK